MREPSAEEKLMTIEGRPTIARHRDSTIMAITDRTPDDTWTALPAPSVQGGKESG